MDFDFVPQVVLVSFQQTDASTERARETTISQWSLQLTALALLCLAGDEKPWTDAEICGDGETDVEEKPTELDEKAT